MVKNIQTVCRHQPTNYLSVFNHFVGLAFKGLGLEKVIVPYDKIATNENSLRIKEYV